MNAEAFLGWIKIYYPEQYAKFEYEFYVYLKQRRSFAKIKQLSEE